MDEMFWTVGCIINFCTTFEYFSFQLNIVIAFTLYKNSSISNLEAIKKLLTNTSQTGHCKMEDIALQTELCQLEVSWAANVPM